MPTETTQGMIQVGPGQFIGADNISDQGKAMAANYQATKDTVKPAPTVLSNANIIEKTIPETINKANTMLGSVTTGSNSVTEGTKGTDDANGSAPSSWSDIYKSLSESLNNDPIQKQELDLLNNMKMQGDATTQAQIGNIHSIYAQRAASLKESQASQTDALNNSLTLAGSNRYAPISSSGILTAKERYDAETLSNLQNEENQAVVGAQVARDTQNYQLLSKNLSILEDVRDKKFNLAKELATNMMNENKTRREELDKLALEAKKNGAPDDVVKAMTSSGSPGAALTAAGDWLQSATGTLGDYLAYKRQASAAGIIPITYDAWTAKEDQKDANKEYNKAYASAKGKAAGEAAGNNGQKVFKPLTEVQAKDYTYAQRGEASMSIIDNLESKITAMNSADYVYQKYLEENSVTHPFASDTIKQVRQAERDFVTSILRRESGAAISQSEFDTAEKQYFPQPGDDATTLAQKQALRATAIDSFKGNVPDYKDRVAQSTGSRMLEAGKIAKTTVDNYIASHPTEADSISKMYLVPGADDTKIYEWLKSNGKIK